MSKSSARSRTELLERLDQTLRRVGAQSVMLSDTVATLVGINSTDLECLDLLDMAGPTTAGRLAQHAGLTTGAMTAVIDRLERAGYVRRLRDPQDRRHVLVKSLPNRCKHVGTLYHGLADKMARLHDDYDDRELALVVEYLTRAVTLVADHVTWLQAQRSPARPAARTRRRPARRAKPAHASRMAGL